MFGTSMKSFLLGRGKYIYSENVFRKALLVGLCCILLSAVCFINALLNLFLWDLNLIPFFMIGVLGGIVGFILNRKQLFEYAKHILLIVSLSLVFIFMSNEGKDYGAQLFIFAIVVASISLFGYTKIRTWLFYSFLALFTFVLTEFTDIRIFQLDAHNSRKEELIYFTNYIFSFIGLIIVIYYQVKLQYKSEQKILAKDQELKESEERFRLALEGTNAGIWDWKNINDDSIWWSPKLYELLGYEPNEIEASRTTFRDLLVNKNDYLRLVNDFQRHLKNQEPFSVEYKFRCKDGSFKWFQGTGQAKWSADDSPVRMVGSIIDITDKKIKEEEIRDKNVLLEKTNAELDKFVYSATHDLRAPLNSIQGLIDVVETTENKEEKSQLMAMMKNRVKKLDGFIDEIINYAKNSRSEIRAEVVSVNDLIDEVFENAQYRDNADSIEFRKLLNSAIRIETDKSRLSIILNNLVDNAIKYHRHKQSGLFVAINVIEYEHHCAIIVEDNGQGIPEVAQEKIFDMFFRASDNSKGSGLGLYIVREMVERLKGNISLKSSKGKGSLFTINLPKVLQKSSDKRATA